MMERSTQPQESPVWDRVVRLSVPRSGGVLDQVLAVLGEGTQEVEVLAPADFQGRHGRFIGGPGAARLNEWLAEGEDVSLKDLIAAADDIEGIDATIYLMELPPREYIAELESDDEAWLIKTRASRATALGFALAGTTPLPLRPKHGPIPLLLQRHEGDP